MKQITKDELYALLKSGTVKNTNHGIVDQNDEPTGFYRTRHKRYIEDKFANLAKKIVEGET